MRTLAEIANGTTMTLLTRAADVILKERRRLVLVAREETPLHLGHLRNMVSVTEMGAIIYPPVPAMYAKPSSIGDILDHTVGRILDLFDIDAGTVRRWQPKQLATERTDVFALQSARSTSTKGGKLMRILVFQHLSVEHPEYFGSFGRTTATNGFAVELDEGEAIPTARRLRRALCHGWADGRVAARPLRLA